ncbi:hypothetical protein VPH46_16075 [Sphingomonas sp. MJ1 (PH-R8)]|uniref:hypothetical protein n=1 Tax=Sphingomonas sp. MJ1 (PH-R8) TaxID=3112950 RepID=UPI003A8C64D2
MVLRLTLLTINPRAEAQAVMRAQLSCRQLAEATVGGALGKVLAKLGARIDGQERESQNHPEPLLDSNLKAKMDADLVGRRRPA